jgi:pyroglutamyl-peptidase
MSPPILLTTFDTWKVDQPSNSSDDLAAELLRRELLPPHIHLLRRIPVDFHLAPATVLSTLEALRPHRVVCCGMAEKRQRLTVELNGKGPQEVIQTTLDLDGLVQNLPHTHISLDAGKFVCNHLYYSVLKHIRDNRIPSQCIFVHVPVLNDHNLDRIVDDFALILKMV